MMSKLEFERLHPRGPDGKFIRKFGIVRWLVDGVWRRGRVVDILEDGSVKVRPYGGTDAQIFTNPSETLYVVRQPKARLDLPEKPEWHAPEMGSARPDPEHVYDVTHTHEQIIPPRPGMGDTSIQVASGRPVRLGVDSIAAYIDPETGKITPERQALHDDIVRSLVDGIERSENPTFVVMGGGPASGKSTVRRSGLIKSVSAHSHVVVEADAIKMKLPEAIEMSAAGDARWAMFVHQESAYLAKRALAASMERRLDVVLDGTGNHASSAVRAKIEGARANGYRVVGEYVTVDTAEAIRRARQRVEETGRIVPETTIRGTHQGVSAALPKLLNDFDETNLYDTSGATPKLIMHATRDGEPEILDSELYAAFLAKARESTRDEDAVRVETAKMPEVVPTNTPGTSIGGVSTNLEDLDLPPLYTKLLKRNMKSKGFTLTEDRQAELEVAKAVATVAIARELGYTPDETTRALNFLSSFLQRWQLTGGQSEERRKMEAAWQRLRSGEPQLTDADRAVAIQKVYTDMTWDTRAMGESPILLIRGVGGEHASRIALADALGEDWAARTWPLTSWAVPGAETSVKNWVVDGVELKSDATTRDDVFLMYHAEPLLREKGLKVKGEYVVDGVGSLNSDEVKVERLFGKKPSNVFMRNSGIEEFVEEGRRFNEQTGGTTDDFVLGKIYDSVVRDADGFGYMLRDDESGLWQVLGFAEAPASVDTPKSVYEEPSYTGRDDYVYVSYHERRRLEYDINNPQRMAVARDLRERGHTAETVSEIASDWRVYQQSLREAADLHKRLALPIDPDVNTFFEDTPASSQKQADYWRDDLIPSYEANARYYASRLEEQRAALGIDDVFVPGLEPPPKPLPGSHHEVPGVGDVDEYLAANPPVEAEKVFEWQSRIVDGLSPDQRHALLFESRERYEPVDFIAEGARQWRADHGQRDPNVDLSEIPVPLRKADAVARVYEETPDQSDDPYVRAAYEDFRRQNEEMWDFMTRPQPRGLGITVTFSPYKDGDPYPSATAQAEDLRVNRHITTQSGLGGLHEATMTREEYDRFRAVHDVFGHAAVGGGFDRHGEYQAYLAHSTMYRGDGRRAMASEYHGVNTALWAGEPDFTPGTGKTILLPDELIPDPFDAGDIVAASAWPQVPGPRQLLQLSVTQETAEALAYLCTQAKIGPDFPAQYDPNPWHSVYVEEMELV